MKAVRVLIVEDDAELAAGLQMMLQNQGYTVCGVASTLSQAYELLQQHMPDISIVDIYLEGKPDGISYAKAIFTGKVHSHAYLFLTSAADRSTFEIAKPLGAFSYLLKPFNEIELQYALELAVEQFAKQPAPSVVQQELKAPSPMHDTLFIKRGNMLAKVLVANIRYIEVDGKYCKVVDQNEKFVVQMPMKQLHDQLPAAIFLRIHRNYIVNLHAVEKIDLHDNEVILNCGTRLALSRRYLDELMHFFHILK
ncbi:LytR/AlgR family response regulator transcription factor [Filimonas effusa]|uniref:Response regulator transcription factor n=1 Tax=Filimonas effusa TaxID=2508721 RepID=A0A4Q1DBN0_9BACT|nr:response regulator transcription factor [Filimonas effusa]RXK86884.1 response regulator transcription factor [Filimonas effusa]